VNELDVTGFDAVDSQGRDDTFIAFLDRVEAMATVAERREVMRGLLCLGTGDRVVDVGCGTGTVAANLAAHGAEVIGVDPSAAMLAVARERHPHIAFMEGVADALPLDDASQSGYCAERVFQHLADPGAALAEANRVLVPGGRVVLQDQDWRSLMIDSDDLQLGVEILDAFAQSVPQPTIGRRFHTLLVDGGFVDVDSQAHVLCTTSTDYAELLTGVISASASQAGFPSADVERWVGDQRRRVTDGRWWMSVTNVIAAARRPGS
jgi:ubiquinone/menaquinone biosynthesis C-methylase UbiE